MGLIQRADLIFLLRVQSAVITSTELSVLACTCSRLCFGLSLSCYSIVCIITYREKFSVSCFCFVCLRSVSNVAFFCHFGFLFLFQNCNKTITYLLVFPSNCVYYSQNPLPLTTIQSHVTSTGNIQNYLTCQLTEYYIMNKNILKNLDIQFSTHNAFLE